jgi:two-component sensor histidine kinase
MSLLDWLFNPSGLTAHGFCLSWAPGLVALHAISDALIGLAYFSIPYAIASFVRRRPDIRYGWVAYLFVGFILACGATHFFSIFTLWVPSYGLEGLVKALTAVLSVVTAVLLWPLMPKLLALPSTTQLEALNAQLRDSEAQVRAANAELEARVAARTAELTEANQHLTDALGERDLLLREVYHRVKNNLQIVDSLLVMQSRQLSDPKAKAALRGLRDRVFALGLVHQQLMGSRDLQTFDFGPFLEELTRNLVDGGPGHDVTLSVKAAPLSVNLDFAIPLGLLVTELITNSLKHAFKGGKGAITVDLTRADDGAVDLVVADDGQGMPAAPAAPIPATARSRAAAGGLGVNIINGLLKQLRGTMTVTSDSGARCHIRVPFPSVSVAA